MTNKSLIGRLLLLSLLILPSKLYAQISTTTCPGAGCVTQNTAGQGSVGVQVTGTWVGTITFYGSIDNSNYVAINLFPPTSAAGVSTTTGNGVFSGSIAGLSTVRVAFTAYTSGSATVTIRTQQSAKAGGVGGSGGGSCAALASNTQILFVSASLCAGSANLTWDGAKIQAGPSASVIDPFTGVPVTLSDYQIRSLTSETSDQTGGYSQSYANFTALTLDARTGANEFSQHALEAWLVIAPTSNFDYHNKNQYGIESVVTHLGSGPVGNLYGIYVDAENDGTGAVGSLYAYNADLLSAGTGTTIQNAYAYSLNSPAQYGSVGITNIFAFWAGAMGGTGTNNYFAWADEQGVFRIRADNTFNSVYQAIPALYNPQLTKYTPGAANFERCIPGCQWESNVAVITTEKGGSGTLRNLKLGDTGTHLILEGTTSTGATGSGNIVFATSPTLTTPIAATYYSDSAKVLVHGTGTGATQLAAAQTTVPTCSANCGTSPSVVGTDTAGIVTMGGTGSPASAWVLTFNGTWAAAPSCTMQMAKTGMANTKLPIVVVTTTTTATVTTNGAAPGNSDVYSYNCIGVQ